MFNSNRAQALTWWRSLSIDQAIAAVYDWQYELPDETMEKKWSFEMIATSSRMIERVYEFTTKQHNQDNHA